VLVVLLVSSCRSGDSERSAEQAVVDRFLTAFSSRDYEGMYAEIDSDAQRVYPQRTFAALNRDAFRLATAESATAGTSTREGSVFTAPVSITTKLFGTIDGRLRLRVQGSGDDARVSWSRNLSFPGLQTGERLSRRATVPARGTIMFRDGTTAIAQGRSRSSTAPAEVVDEVRGALGPIPESDRAKYQALGLPSDTKVGVSGLERLLNDELIGRPALTLRAGGRVIGRQRARPARTVVSSLSLPVMEAAVQAQATAPDGGGTTTIDTRTGEVLAFTGDAWRDARAPGSTMKIVTAAAALQEGTTGLDTEYPPATSALGIQNADGESCGGTLVVSFARSCNSVFAPLAIAVGAEPFRKMARAFGFDDAPSVDGAEESTVPEDLDDTDLALSGIGQSGVRATPLEVAMMATTVATGGLRPTLTFERRTAEARTRRVLDGGVASDLRTMMEAVITQGTGRSAAIPGAFVAGKTGTAEVRTTQGPACGAPRSTGTDGDSTGRGTSTTDGGTTDGVADRGRRPARAVPAGLVLAQSTTDPTDDPALEDPTTTDGDPTTTTPDGTSTGDATPVDPLPATPDDAPTICDPSDSTDTDAWMSAFAEPGSGGGDPVAVGVLRRGDGQGGDTAAPVARAILQAAIRR
jgi:hypothetical protein